MNDSALLPGRCSPQPDELLSSWISRLALNHGMSPIRFWHLFLSRQRFQWKPTDPVQYDFERFKHPEFVSLLATRTATPPERIYETTLWDYELFVDRSIHNANRLHYTWLLPFQPCKQSTSPYSIGPGFCAGCLRKDDRPYFRKRWRFSFVVACLDCGFLLHHQCPNCQCAVDYRQLNGKRSGYAKGQILAEKISFCYNCGYDLAQTPNRPAASIVLTQQRILQSFDTSYQAVHHEPTRVYFHRLASLTNDLVRASSDRTREEPTFPLGFADERVCQMPGRFDAWPPDLRARLLYQAMTFLQMATEDFPRLLKKPSHHLLARFMQAQPWWRREEWSAFG